MITDTVFQINTTLLKYSSNPFIITFHLLPYVRKAAIYFLKKQIKADIKLCEDIEILLYDFLKFLDLSGYRYNFNDPFLVKANTYTQNGVKRISSIICKIKEDSHTIEIEYIFNDGSPQFLMKYLYENKILTCTNRPLDASIEKELKKHIYEEVIRIYTLTMII